MSSKIARLINCILIISTILVGCSSTLDENIKTLKTSKITMKSDKNYEYESIDFNLGKKYINDDNQKEPYYLRGTMSLPSDIKNEKLKLVLIVHGCHDRSNLRRFDTGFKYLTDFLAQNGYLAVSMDVNAAFDSNYGEYEEYKKIPIMVDEHIKSLQKANQGEIYYGENLQDKIDFDNISIIGHSTGGEVIFKIVEKQRKKGIKIDNLLAIAPTTNKKTNYNIDIDNISILVPGLDGDVTALCGLNIYNMLRKEDNKLKILSATTLKYANHNYFNSKVINNDAELEGMDLTNQISRYEQEKFLQQFTVNFLDVCYGSIKKNTIYDDEIGSVTEINNLRVLNYLSTKGRKELINIKDLIKARRNKIKLELVQDCSPIDKDTALGINLPGRNPYTTDLISITWEDKGGKLSFKPEMKDISDYENISINVLVDGLNKLNKEDELQSFSVELVDYDRVSQTVEIKNESKLLEYPSGEERTLKVDGSEPMSYWSEITPMNNVRIPLNLYDEIDLRRIKRINILFNNTDSGSLMFESFSVNK